MSSAVIEEALRKFAGNGANGGGEVPEITAAERIDKIGNVSALAIIEASETTAKDIEGAAQAAVDIAADIMAEAKQLATELRANGKKMGEHLKEFAALR
jgi:vacuolar-type H+-ATPase subunit H